MEKLFEMALELARKHIDSTIGVYPYDLLTHDEKIAALAKVAVAVAGYGSCPKDALHESALYALYVHAAKAAQNDPNADVWRGRVVEAYDSECKWTQARGLDDSARIKKEACAVMIDILAERYAPLSFPLFLSLSQYWLTLQSSHASLVFKTLSCVEWSPMAGAPLERTRFITNS